MTLRSKDADVNKPKTHQWLKSTSLKVETGTFISTGPTPIHWKLPGKHNKN